MSLAFSVENRPGSLVAALNELSAMGTNLTKIESRPVQGKPWEYIFYVDCQLHSADEGRAPGGAETALRDGEGTGTLCRSGKAGTPARGELQAPIFRLPPASLKVACSIKRGSALAIPFLICQVPADYFLIAL